MTFIFGKASVAIVYLLINLSALPVTVWRFSQTVKAFRVLHGNLLIDVFKAFYS